MTMGVYVRAKAGDRWVSANVAHLTEWSFRALLLSRLAECGVWVGVKEEGDLVLEVDEKHWREYGFQRPGSKPTDEQGEA